MNGINVGRVKLRLAFFRTLTMTCCALAASNGSAQTSEYQGWFWETALENRSDPELREEVCFGPLSLSIADADDSWTAAGEEVCYGRTTTNTNPARNYFNFDSATGTFEDVATISARSTRALVGAGGNLLEFYGEGVDDMGGGTGEERVGTILAEPDDGDILIIGDYQEFDFGSAAATNGTVHVLVKQSPDVAAARVPADLTGSWRISGFVRSLANTNVNTEVAVITPRILNLQSGGLCNYQVAGVLTEPEVDTNLEGIAIVQGNADGVDLGNRTAFAQITDQSVSGCTWQIDADDYLAIAGTLNNGTGSSPFSARFVVSDDNGFLAPALEVGGFEAGPKGLRVGFRAPSALPQNAIDGNFLVHLNMTDFNATGTGHSMGAAGDQEFDGHGRGLLSFDSGTIGTPPAGLGGTWYACDLNMVLSAASYGVSGQPAMATVATSMAVGTSPLNVLSCDYNLLADGSLLVNLTLPNQGEPSEQALFAGYVNDTGDLLTLVDISSQPALSPPGQKDRAAIRHMIGMRYVGDLDGDEDGDGTTNLEEFQLPLPPPPVTRFTDVPAGYWAYAFIDALADSGVTSGCGGGNYCPENPVTRAQMAVFLERGMRGSGYSPPAALGNVFLDVGAGAFAAAFIEQLSRDGITAGCGGNNYCPTASVTRAQMAIFLLRAIHGAGYSPPPPSGAFGDVSPAYWAAAWIEQLAAEGITSGCGGGNFCPNNPVNRAQMAVFLVRAFGL